jgi:hypothetical protein
MTHERNIIKKSEVNNPEASPGSLNGIQRIERSKLRGADLKIEDMMKSNIADLDDLMSLSPDTLAKLLDGDDETIRRACLDGRIPAAKISRPWRNRLAVVKEIVKNGLPSGMPTTKRTIVTTKHGATILQPAKAWKDPVAQQNAIDALVAAGDKEPALGVGCGDRPKTTFHIGPQLYHVVGTTRRRSAATGQHQENHHNQIMGQPFCNHLWRSRRTERQSSFGPSGIAGPKANKGAKIRANASVRRVPTRINRMEAFITQKLNQ